MSSLFFTVDQVSRAMYDFARVAFSLDQQFRAMASAFPELELTWQAKLKRWWSDCDYIDPKWFQPKIVYVLGFDPAGKSQNKTVYPRTEEEIQAIANGGLFYFTIQHHDSD